MPHEIKRYFAEAVILVILVLAMCPCYE